MKKKFLCAAIAFAIALTMIPLNAFALGEAETTTIAQVTQLTNRIIPSGNVFR